MARTALGTRELAPGSDAAPGGETSVLIRPEALTLADPGAAAALPSPNISRC